MEKRKKLYEEQDERGKTALAEAEEKKSTYDELMSKADEEISEKKRLVIADARGESEKIIKAAEEQASAVLKKANAQAEEIKKRSEEEAREALSDVIARAAIEKIDAACTVDGFLAENKQNDR